MPELDAAYVNSFMKEINDIADINNRSEAHLGEKSNETYMRYNLEHFPHNLPSPP